MKKSILFLAAFASITSSTALAHETNPVSCTRTKPATATATVQQQKVPWLFAQNTENTEYRRGDAAQYDTIDDGSDIVPHDDATKRDTINDGSDIVPHDDATRRDTIDDADHDLDDNDGNM